MNHIITVMYLTVHCSKLDSCLFLSCSVTQEAVATGDPEMVQLCLQYRDFQRYTRRTEGVPGLLQRLKEVRCCNFLIVDSIIKDL